MAEWIIEIKDGKFPIGKWTELVRCKGCKHYERLMHLCRKFDEYGLAESDFCSRGERKESEEC